MSNVTFEDINRAAELYFSTRREVYRIQLSTYILSAMSYETDSQRQTRINRYPYSSVADDWVYLFGAYAPVDLIISLLQEALGEKTKGNGEKSQSGYNPEKSTFTTYFIFLIKKRVNDVYFKEPVVSLDEIAETAQPAAGDENISCVSDTAIVCMAEFFSEVLKSRKVLSMTRGIYSLHLVNYTRAYMDGFEQLNCLSDLLFEPSEEGFLEKMTMFSTQERRDFLGLSQSDLSAYVFDNNLDKSLSKKHPEIRVLKDKSVSAYYCSEQQALCYQMKTLNRQLSRVLREKEIR